MSKNNEKRSFEQAMADLEKIVRAIESGEVPLAQALAQYEQGTELVSYCQKVLAEAERKIAKLSKGLDGQLKIEEAPNLSDPGDSAK